MMDNPNNNLQESMNLKAAKMVYQLVESTERFLTTVGELNAHSIRAMGSDVNDHINRVIQQYEHVCMIVNAIQAISLCVSDPQHRNSLVTAATSASTSSSTALSRIYSQFSSLQLDDNVARESLSQLALLVPQAKLVNVKPEESNSSNVDTMPLQICPPPSPPSNQEIDNERRELALKRKLFDEEREEFEREKKRLLVDKESIDEKLKEQQSIEQQEQQQKMFEQQQQMLVQQQQQQQLKEEQEQLKQQRLKEQQEALKQQQQERQQQQLKKQQEILKQQQQEQLKRQQQQEQLKQQQQQHLQLQQQRHEQRISELKKLEQEKDQIREQQDKENLAKQRQQINVLSTDQFLEQFEKTAQTFAQSINMGIDNVWESMLIHALPKDKVPWANETIIGKKHSWRYAKHMYYKKYAENRNNTSAPSSPTGPPAATVPSSSIPAVSTAAVAATNAAAQATASASTNGAVPATGAPTTATTNVPLTPLQRLLARPAPSTTDPPRERDQRRVADYCQHLLSLEMKFYDTIEEYNKRYMRYCTIANVDLTGKSFIDRYIRSLDPKYRGIVSTALQLHKQPLNHIKDVMAVAEETINAYIAASPARKNAPYSQNCIHNRKVNQTV